MSDARERTSSTPRSQIVDRIPSGTRDVLPDEMRELRAMTNRISGVFERAGYGEVYTPALEYEGTFAVGSGGAPSTRC